MVKPRGKKNPTTKKNPSGSLQCFPRKLSYRQILLLWRHLQHVEKRNKSLVFEAGDWLCRQSKADNKKPGATGVNCASEHFLVAFRRQLHLFLCVCVFLLNQQECVLLGWYVAAKRMNSEINPDASLTDAKGAISIAGISLLDF